MCTYYYLHYHHVAPCARPIDYAVHYTFCGHAAAPAPSGNNNNNNNNPDNHHHQQGQSPCAALAYDPASTGAGGMEAAGCAAGETGCCLVSQQCSSGGCRLQDLGGRWTCCRCRRGGNTFRWCVHPMRKVPDTLCYHVVCQDCQADG
ncbi:hypothetical protein F4809DRAFT_640449 [Biscogniauxia mediterranea]|nr:hypothetical protein F4809DRAFT_640449 [Biscogniauxia mediterranea]